MFLGAGASKAAGLPLTEELLKHIWPRDHENGIESWARCRDRGAWKRDLEKAVKVMYPDGGSPGFRPLVSDFFTLLEVIDRVHSDRQRLPMAPTELLRDLRSEIAHGLLAAVAGHRRGMANTPHYRWLLKPNTRPHVIITSNWDTLVEQAALKAGMNVVLGLPKRGDGAPKAELPPNTLVVLKLHGSVDWGAAEDEECLAQRSTWKYERLDAFLSPAPHPRSSTRNGGEEALRFRTYDAPVASDAILTGFKTPMMATMAAGKDQFISGAVKTIWSDAYWVLERSKRLDIVGYSFPPDDLELRSLLRLTTRKAGEAVMSENLDVSVCNPSPDTHERARSLLGAGLSASYMGADSFTL
jgi:hypothetical protein